MGVIMSRAERAERRARIAEFCRDATVAEAAKRFKVSRFAVYRSCAEHGVELRRDPDAATVVDAVALVVRTRRSWSAIAEATGITRATVRTIADRCAEAGFKVPERGPT